MNLRAWSAAAALVVGSAGTATAGAAASPTEPASADIAASRVLFEANLQAIRDRDREAYLACYLPGASLARTGPSGFELGFEGLAASAAEGWPDVFEAQDLRLTPVADGLVYGTYRYRVRYEEVEQAGLSERLFLRTPNGWKIAVTTAFAAPAATPPPPRALVAATLLDGHGGQPVPDAVVLLRDGRIECAGSRDDCPVPAGVGAVDLAGHWLTPGLVDAHVHLSQSGWADGRPDALDLRAEHPYAAVVAELQAHPERFLRSYLCSGVTAIFDVGGYPWTLDLARDPRRSTDTEAPRLAAAGPLLSTWDFWLNLPGEQQFVYLADEAQTRESVRYVAARGADAIKIWFIPSEERPLVAEAALVRAAGEAAREAGLPLIVHATGLAEAKAAVAAGARLLVHSVDEPIDDGFVAAARAAGVLYCPTLTVQRGYEALRRFTADGVEPALDDPNSCVDSATRAKLASTPQLAGGEDGSAADLERIEGTQRASLKLLWEAGVEIVMGTDAGNPFTLHGPSVYAEMEAMQAAGLPPLAVLTAATRGGARAMGLDEEIGTVEAGKVADLLVVAADPSLDIAAMRELRWVVRGGVMRSIEELSELASR